VSWQSRAGRLRIVERDWNTSPIVRNGLESLIGIAAGVLAGSISLVGFEIDSLIEVASGATLLWRM
jgi:hypothetical protein